MEEDRDEAYYNDPGKIFKSYWPDAMKPSNI